MRVKPGKFNKRITIVAEIEESKDEEGYPIGGEDEIATVWASVKPVSSKDYFSAKATQSENIMQFRFRYRKGIDSDMSIIYHDSKYEIESIINDEEADRTLTVMGKEVR